MARPLNALIVDDCSTMRMLIMRMLEQTGLADFEFTEANDGIEGLEKFQPSKTQIIFVDMNMPRMDGLSFVRKLRTKTENRPPVVMITGESDQERLAEAINEPGVDAFLLKPVDRDRLQTGLRKIVNSIPEESGTSSVPNGGCVAKAFQDILLEACGTTATITDDNMASRDGQIVMGIISLHGDIHWSTALGFTQEAAQAIASGFAGYEMPADGLDLGDAIGEISNIVAGRIKQLLSERDMTAKMSLPTVIAASGFRNLLQGRKTTTTVTFKTPVGSVWSTVTAGIHPGMVL